MLLLSLVPSIYSLFSVAIHRFRYVNKWIRLFKMKIFTFFGCLFNVLCVSSVVFMTHNEWILQHNINAYRSITATVFLYVLLKSFNLNFIFWIGKNSKFQMLHFVETAFRTIWLPNCVFMSIPSMLNAHSFLLETRLYHFNYLNQHVCKRHIHTRHKTQPYQPLKYSPLA